MLDLMYHETNSPIKIVVDDSFFKKISKAIT